jgi:hypothetical protein
MPSADSMERLAKNATKSKTRRNAMREANRKAGRIPGSPQAARLAASGGAGGAGARAGRSAGGSIAGISGEAFEPVADFTDYSVSPVQRSAEKWTLETDPVYLQAIAGGQSAFNVARARALSDLQNQQSEAARAEREIGQSAASSRQRLAGNFAARGMAGGGYGSLSRAEAEANARQIAAQTDIKDQMAAVSQQYLANFGAEGTDWTGTLIGQDYRNQAIQQAMMALLPRYTGV